MQHAGKDSLVWHQMTMSVSALKAYLCCKHVALRSMDITAGVVPVA